VAPHATRHQLSVPPTHTHTRARTYTPSALTLHTLCHAVAGTGPACTKEGSYSSITLGNNGYKYTPDGSYFWPVLGQYHSGHYVASTIFPNGPCFKRPEYIGCYHEHVRRYFGRVGGNQITIDECAKAAARAGFALFGMQWPVGGVDIPVATTAYCMFDLNGDRTNMENKDQEWPVASDDKCQELQGEYKSKGFKTTYNHHGGHAIVAFYSMSGESLAFQCNSNHRKPCSIERVAADTPLACRQNRAVIQVPTTLVTSPAPHGATCGEAPCDTLKVA
jgi:hypothetical protein